ncbi:Transcriptional repressor tup12-related protein [Tritrichomonas foetus]|uniref:Transcriptional repressor tup12-related protein n=1 Tax=Tritrichomonas foetus TaxID=1144522 RepID=A0A1J4J8U4_9EUKA|nr:Transcriptional repressor tup12-related protein [Tritrichomonas foetus]|eukprot:OHS95560.1 Transcriptional repressor tup12-related protein [Tritrichomonas foetus]
MSKSQALHVTLHSTVGENDKTGESIIQKIQEVRRSVATLRDTNLDLERIRDQYIIHLQQCQEDHEVLRQIYKKLKMRLDMSAPAPDQVQIENAIGGFSSQEQQHPSVSTPHTKRMPTIESIKLTPSIESFSPNFHSSKITLRYAINTSTVLCTVQFNLNGSKFAFADESFVYVINSEDGDIISCIELNTHDQVNYHTRALKFSPKDDLLAVSGPNNDVLLYDSASGKLIHTFSGHTGDVSGIAFNADGSWLISGGFDGLIFIWDTKTFAEVNRLNPQPNEEGNSVVGIATTPEIPFYAIGFSNGSIGIYNDTFTPPMTTFSAHNQTLMNLAVSPFDDSITTASKDNTAKVWMMRGVASCKHTLQGHTDFVLSATFSHNLPILFTGSKDQTIRMWHQKSGVCYCSISAHKNTVFQLDHHPTKSSFVSCDGDGVVCLWDYSL